jgi:hypothetical protein
MLGGPGFFNENASLINGTSSAVMYHGFRLDNYITLGVAGVSLFALVWVAVCHVRKRHCCASSKTQDGLLASAADSRPDEGAKASAAGSNPSAAGSNPSAAVSTVDSIFAFANA